MTASVDEGMFGCHGTPSLLEISLGDDDDGIYLRIWLGPDADVRQSSTTVWLTRAQVAYLLQSADMILRRQGAAS